MRIPKAFISYSWDNERHKSWVLRLASRLRRNGVDVRLDRWDVKPGQSLTQFMETQLEECDFVLVICTPNYRARSVKRTGGVGYEQQIISGHIAAGAKREKFIPVVRDGDFSPGDHCAVPPHFLGIYALDARTPANADIAFEQLLRTLHNKPAIAKPSIGGSPFARAPRGWGDIRLPTADLDGYELVSGAAQNARHPKSFWIPARNRRTELLPGSIVKLMFDIRPKKGNATCERMWVVVAKKVGPYFVGLLDNIPLNATTKLRPRSRIVFLPEHIINIHSDAKMKSVMRPKKKRSIAARK